jgi:hypothetical protein
MDQQWLAMMVEVVNWSYENKTTFDRFNRIWIEVSHSESIEEGLCIFELLKISKWKFIAAVK